VNNLYPENFSFPFTNRKKCCTINNIASGGEVMYCLKCGKDTKREQVFCDSCLKGMLPYPVKPDTPVNIPHREPIVIKKQSGRKRNLPPEEQVVQLRKLARRMALTIAVLFLLLALAVAMLVKQQLTPDNTPGLGTNYTVDTTLDS
jgi:hypothetical protein